jgi:hypothetical protein
LGVVANQPLRATRANRIFRTDEKRIRTENTVMDKGNSGPGLVLCNIAILKQPRGAVQRGSYSSERAEEAAKISD